MADLPSAPCDCAKVRAGMASLNADHDRLLVENRRLREGLRDVERDLAGVGSRASAVRRRVQELLNG